MPKGGESTPDEEYGGLSGLVIIIAGAFILFLACGFAYIALTGG